MTGLKTTYITLALCLMAACSATDAPDPGGTGTDGVEMRFAVPDPTGNTSRAAATNRLDVQGSEFAIYGDRKSLLSSAVQSIFTGENVAYDQKTKAWTYADPRFWFPGFEYSFVAIHPAGASGISGTNYHDNTLQFTYTLPTDYRETPDLLLATHRRDYEETPFTDDPAATVRLRFTHVMSRINFAVENVDAAETVRVTQIDLEGINRTGTFTITPAPLSSSGKQTDDYTSGWTDIATPANLTAPIEVDVKKASTASLFPDANALFLLPQPDNNAIITRIAYTLIYANGNSVNRTLVAQTPIGGWEPGKIYTYSLSLNAESNNVSLNLTVSDWAPGAGNDVTVPRK